MLTLNPTDEVQRFLTLLESGMKPVMAAQQSGLNPHEALLIRKMAGLKVATPQKNISEKVVNLRSQGLTHQQIAEQVEISRSYVNSILQKHRRNN